MSISGAASLALRQLDDWLMFLSAEEVGNKTEEYSYSERAQAWLSTSRATMSLALRQLADWLVGLVSMGSRM